MKYLRFVFLIPFIALCLSSARADMVVETTRVIYPEAKREVSFKVSNVNKERPAFYKCGWTMATLQPRQKKPSPLST